MTKLFVLTVVTTLLCPLASVAQLVPSGAEFQVTVHTAGGQDYPASAMAGDGSFVVAWDGDDGYGGGVFARRFGSAGQALGGEFQVNTCTVGGQAKPALAAAADGAFVAVWLSDGQDGSGYGVFGQRFDSAGQAVGTEFQANTYTEASQGDDGDPAIAAAPDGSFVVTWAGDGQDGDGLAAMAQLYDSNGQPVGTEFQANSYTIGSQYMPEAAMDASGSFVLAWSSPREGGSPGIAAQRFDDAGQPVGAEFQVNTYTMGAQLTPALAPGPSGSFLVAWYDDDGHDGAGGGIFARRFDGSGQGVGTEFQVNTYTPGSQSYPPKVAAGANGEYVVVWRSARDGDGFGVFARRYDSAGQATGNEIQINTFTQDWQWLPDVSGALNGSFVVSWQSESQDGDGSGVFAQFFGSSAFCGNNTVDGGEDCDDGNTNDGDGCDSNCTVTACGNGILTGSEECDDGNVSDGDGCSAVCGDTSTPENLADPELTAGETLTSDTEADGATPEDPVETSITLFAGTAAVAGTAAATIAEISGAGPSVPGYAIFGQQVQINFTCTGTCATPTAPLTLSFRIDASRIPSGVDENNFAVLRDGVVIGPCTGSPGVASPDPCVDDRTLFGDGDIGATILTSLASEWSFAKSVCSATPIACDDPGTAIFSVKKTTGDPSATKLIWKWLKGSIASQSAFGDPTAGTGYTLCVYDGAALVESHSITGAGDCDDSPCWKPVGDKGYKYKNPAGNDAGITKVLLKSGPGKSKILVKGKGTNLVVPSSDPIYAQSPDVSVQLVSSGGGCWQAVYPSGATTSSGEKFQDKIQ